MRQDPPERVWAVRFRDPQTGAEMGGWQLCANPETMKCWRQLSKLAEEREYVGIVVLDVVFTTTRKIPDEDVTDARVERQAPPDEDAEAAAYAGLIERGEA